MAVVATENGPLWASGPVIRTQPSGRTQISVPAGPTFSNRAGWLAAISFGRPVLPPLVISFQSGATPGVNSPAGSCAGTSSRTGREPLSAAGTPTIRAGSERSAMAARSSAGRRLEIGFGTAPTAHAANMLSTNPIEFGSPIVTVEPSVTPRSANSAARRSTRPVNSARFSVWSLQVSAGRSGSAAASWRRTERNVVTCTYRTYTGPAGRPGSGPLAKAPSG